MGLNYLIIFRAIEIIPQMKVTTSFYRLYLKISFYHSNREDFS